MLVAIAWVGVGLQPAFADGIGDDAVGVSETTEAEAGAAGSPSGIAGLSLLVAAVVATLWNVASGERRARPRAPTRTG